MFLYMSSLGPEGKGTAYAVVYWLVGLLGIARDSARRMYTQGRADRVCVLSYAENSTERHESEGSSGETNIHEGPRCGIAGMERPYERETRLSSIHLGLGVYVVLHYTLM